MSEITSILAKELIIVEKKIDAALKLLDEGNTIPFIARYRKEVTGELDEEQIRNISERAQYLRNLAERRRGNAPAPGSGPGCPGLPPLPLRPTFPPGRHPTGPGRLPAMLQRAAGHTKCQK